MAELNASATSITTSTVADFTVETKALDTTNATDETYWYFSEATKNFGYYKTIPELKSAIDALCIWAVGKGWETEDKILKATLEHIIGWGEDTVDSVFWNILVTKKIVGDAFAEIIEKNNILINLKPISPERVRVVVENSGMIKRYDIWNGSKWKEMDKSKILHLCNDRIGDEIHGNSVIDACKWIIDARNEALKDERLIRHRELAMGILEIDTDNTTKRNAIMKQYADAVKNGEVLVLPKGTAELKNNPVTPQNRLEWIRYLENFFYQTVRVPRIIATNEGATEAGGKVGYLTFEPIYTKEQTDLEGDLWNQMAIKIKFNRPASLGGTVQQDEAKNTGQLGIQPNDVAATITPE